MIDMSMIMCADVDECDDVYMCQRSGTCTNFVGSYLCQCMMGWTGARCEVCKLFSSVRTTDSELSQLFPNIRVV